MGMMRPWGLWVAMNVNALAVGFGKPDGQSFQVASAAQDTVNLSNSLEL